MLRAPGKPPRPGGEFTIGRASSAIGAHRSPEGRATRAVPRPFAPARLRLFRPSVPRPTCIYRGGKTARCARRGERSLRRATRVRRRPPSAPLSASSSTDHQGRRARMVGRTPRRVQEASLGGRPRALQRPDQRAAAGVSGSSHPHSLGEFRRQGHAHLGHHGPPGPDRRGRERSLSRRHERGGQGGRRRDVRPRGRRVGRHALRGAFAPVERRESLSQLPLAPAPRERRAPGWPERLPGPSARRGRRRRAKEASRPRAASHPHPAAGRVAPRKATSPRSVMAREASTGARGRRTPRARPAG